jgi:hypothetical protein
LQIAGHSLLWNVVCERHGANVWEMQVDHEVAERRADGGVVALSAAVVRLLQTGQYERSGYASRLSCSSVADGWTLRILNTRNQHALSFQGSSLQQQLANYSPGNGGPPYSRFLSEQLPGDVPRTVWALHAWTPTLSSRDVFQYYIQVDGEDGTDHLISLLRISTCGAIWGTSLLPTM